MIRFEIQIRCDRCGESFTHTGDRAAEMPAEHRILPDDWVRISDPHYKNLDLCSLCAALFQDWLEAG